MHRIQGYSCSQLKHLITFAQLLFYKALVSVSKEMKLKADCNLFIPFLFVECLYVKADTISLAVKYFGIWGLTSAACADVLFFSLWFILRPLLALK